MKKLMLNILFLAVGIAGISQGNVGEAFSKSYEYEASGEYTNAISSINSIYDATSYTQNIRLGWLYYLSGEQTKSQAYYKKAIELEPKSIEARLGYVYPTSVMQNWDDVIKTYKDILVLDANNSLVNYRLAYIYYVRKDFDSAGKYAQNVISLYPFDFDANYLLGQIYIAQGKIKEAKIHLTRARDYNPSSTDVKSLLEKL